MAFYIVVGRFFMCKCVFNGWVDGSYIVSVLGKVLVGEEDGKIKTNVGIFLALFLL